jgi:hypothetical protein
MPFVNFIFYLFKKGGETEKIIPPLGVRPYQRNDEIDSPSKSPVKAISSRGHRAYIIHRMKNKKEKTMTSLNEKIKSFGVLCKKGYHKGLTKKEDREFKKLEKDISDSMLNDEELFDDHIKSLRKAVGPLLKFGFDLTK